LLCRSIYSLVVTQLCGFDNEYITGEHARGHGSQPGRCGGMLARPLLVTLAEPLHFNFI
jgi:hypothetical protein